MASLLSETFPSASVRSAAVTRSGLFALVKLSLNFAAPHVSAWLRASVAASNMPRPPVFVMRLPLVPPVSVVLSVSMYGVIVICVSGTPSASAAIITMCVRWPEPMSVVPETACTLPSLLMMT